MNDNSIIEKFRKTCYKIFKKSCFTRMSPTYPILKDLTDQIRRLKENLTVKQEVNNNKDWG